MRELNTKSPHAADDFEDDLRRMLHRRAGDIASMPSSTTASMTAPTTEPIVSEPTKIHLVESSAGSDTFDGFDSGNRLGVDGQRSPRWLAAAAAVLVVAIVGGLAALSGGGNEVSNVVSADPAHNNDGRVARPKQDKPTSTTSADSKTTSGDSKQRPKSTKVPKPVTPAPAPTNGPSETTVVEQPTTVVAPSPGSSIDPTIPPNPEQPEPSRTTEPPETTVPTTAAPQPSTPRAPGSGDVTFSENFAEDGSLGRFDFDIYHRDDHVVRDTEWVGDHVSTGPNDLCGPPTEKRTVSRGDRSSGFNDDWIYRCVPGGDRGKAHIMTSIGDTSGYSIGAFSPKPVFSDVTEVRWDVNQTDLGDRQWTEVVLVPASGFSFDNLPCAAGLPCGTTTHEEVGAVGTHWTGLGARTIHTPSQSGGYTQAGGDLGYRCDGCPYSPSRRFGEAYGAGDPALTSIAVRRHNFFRDNGDGTLTWGFHLADGTVNEFTVPGSFPDGPVRVVFKDHNYTPLKSPATLLPETTFTWHWDNIEVSVG